MKMIITDRDGILNKLLYDPILQKFDSPMSIDQIIIFPWVSKCLKELKNLGFSIAVATNQPSAAKGKITKEQLTIIHNHILTMITQEAGVLFGSSHICFHREEDKCICRKPNIGMLEQAWINGFDKSKSWMIGDMKKTDILAGNSFGVSTALLNQSDEDNPNIVPTFIGKDLRDFVNMLKDKND